VLSAFRNFHTSGPAAAVLDLASASREHFTRAGSPSQIGDERGNTDSSRSNALSSFECEASRGCPRNCERRALGPDRPLGNWEGRTNKATTREPGDLPAQSPNRWTGRPYGAVFRSGDGNADAKAVRANLPRHFACEAGDTSHASFAFFATGLVFTDASARQARSANEGTLCHGTDTKVQRNRCSGLPAARNSTCAGLDDIFAANRRLGVAHRNRHHWRV